MSAPQRTPVGFTNPLDAYIQRLQNMEPFNVNTINEQGEVQDWYTVTGPDIVPQLVIREQGLAMQVQSVSAELMHWGRHTAQCLRIFQIEERRFRQWKAHQFINAIKTADAAKEKKPSDKVIEATYRTNPEYETMSERVERAEEAYHAADYIREAFRAKKDMMSRSISPAKDGTGPRFSVP